MRKRSATAAKEIKSLIAASSQEVKLGVKLVSETAEALQSVTEKVARIDTLLSQMVLSAQEQAAGLGEVNSAVNRMDQVTQQNASMIAEATGAAATLKNEAGAMASLMGEFRIGQAADAPAQAAKPRLVETARRQQSSSTSRRVA